MIIRDPAKLKELERVFPWYAETRPHQVKQMGFDPLGKWAVGPTPERRVRWLFESQEDQMTFSRKHRAFLLVGGYLGPLRTETRIFK